LGTGGGIAFAGRELEGSFFALNGDSLREADLSELVRLHRSTGAKATILLTPVADPSRYGLVRLAGDGRVETFLEKPRPEEIDTDLINAGLYVLEPEVLDLVPEGRAVSIERDVFPRLAEDGSVYGVALAGYWLDVGTPESYLQAHRDVLERAFPTEVGDALGPDFTLVDPSAEVHPAARLVPPVYVGPNAVLEAGARAGSLAVLGEAFLGFALRNGRAYADRDIIAQFNDEVPRAMKANPLVEIPGDILLVGRVMGILSGVGKQLGSDVDPAALLMPFLAGPPPVAGAPA